MVCDTNWRDVLLDQNSVVYLPYRDPLCSSPYSRSDFSWSVPLRQDQEYVMAQALDLRVRSMLLMPFWSRFRPNAHFSSTLKDSVGGLALRLSLTERCRRFRRCVCN